jgi:uncharacterized repeat protein (TIGR03803 family)
VAHGKSLRQFMMQPMLTLSATIAVISLMLMSATVARAQTFSVLYHFCVQSSCPTGLGPNSLIQGTDGEFYGIATSGGLNDAAYCLGFDFGQLGCGTVFRLSASGKLSTLYSFCNLPNCADGAFPSGALLQANDGDLYGTTAYGGTNGSGTLFKITASGRFTTLYNFCSLPNCADGAVPAGPLIQGADGDLYGVTVGGGAYASAGCTIELGCGTLFKIAPAGTLTTLHTFCSLPNCDDGWNPPGALVQVANGDFYGTTGNGAGSVFKMTPGGTFTTLYMFCSLPDCGDGGQPSTGLTQAANGNFYGTTDNDGINGGGTVFEITPSGTLTTVYGFCSGDCVDGTTPFSGVILASNGDLYGTTLYGGTQRGGTVFQLTPGGELTTLFNFCDTRGPCARDGTGAYRPLLQATDGMLYGTTLQGGVRDGGMIFSDNLGLGPFIALKTSFGEVGTKVILLGTDLTGASSVTFNGAPATFTVNSTGSAITTTVPTAATTGTVQVVTPNGALNSNVVYKVR